MNKNSIKALNSPFISDNTKVTVATIREYLTLLLKTMWQQGADFNGKRPFGDGHWQFQLYKNLIEYGFISGSLDSDGYIDDFDEDEAQKFVQEMINDMCAQ